MSQQQLADRVVPPTTKTQISKLELAQRRLSDGWLFRLAAALQCHPADLMVAIPRTSVKEEAMLGIFRGLSDEDQEAFIRLADALAKSSRGRDA